MDIQKEKWYIASLTCNTAEKHGSCIMAQSIIGNLDVVCLVPDHEANYEKHPVFVVYNDQGQMIKAGSFKTAADFLCEMIAVDLA